MTFSGDKLLGGPQAGIIAGRSDLVAACAAHPLARALRPGGLVLSALQDVLLAYLRRDAGRTVPFWRMATLPVSELEDRARAVLTAAGPIAEPLGLAVEPMESLPGAGSLPGTAVPSAGLVLDGDRSAELRLRLAAGHRPGAGRADLPRPADGRAVRRRPPGHRARRPDPVAPPPASP